MPGINLFLKNKIHQVITESAKCGSTICAVMAAQTQSEVQASQSFHATSSIYDSTRKPECSANSSRLQGFWRCPSRVYGHWINIGHGLPKTAKYINLAAG